MRRGGDRCPAGDTGLDPGHGRIVHRRPGGPPHHQRAGQFGLLSGWVRRLRQRGQGRDTGRAPRDTAGSRRGQRGDGAGDGQGRPPAPGGRPGGLDSRASPGRPGGTPEKPVGLVYVALSAPDVELCQRYVWQGDRLANKEQSAEAALQLLLSYLQARHSAAGRGCTRSHVGSLRSVAARLGDSPAGEPPAVKGSRGCLSSSTNR